MSIGPLLPIIVPLGGALVAWLLPRQTALPLRRWFHALVLLICGVSLLATWGSERVLSLEVEGTRVTLSLAFDSLAGSFALLLCIALVAIDLAALDRFLGRGRAVGSLLLVSAGIAGCAATNLISLCLAWGALDLALLGLEATQTSEQQETDARRFIAGNVLSTLLIFTSALWVIFEQGRSILSPFSLQGTPLILVSVAAWLRLGLYPLPASYAATWESTLVAFGTGAALWARVVSLASSTQALRGASLFVAVALLATSYLAASARDRSSAQHYLMRHGVGMMILAPLLHRQLGFAVVLLSAANLLLGLTLLQAEHARTQPSSAPLWSRLPMALGSLTILGWPLTLGASVRWLLLEVGRAQGLSLIYYLVLLSYVLASIPAWRIRKDLEVPHPGGESRGQIGAWIGTGALALPAMALLLVGFAPGIIDRIWTQSLPLRLPSWSALLGSRSIFSFSIVLFFPILASFLVGRMIAGRAELNRSDTGVLGYLLRLNWLYLMLEEGLLVAQRLLREAISILEGSLVLGWTLMWTAAIILYLLNG